MDDRKMTLSELHLANARFLRENMRSGEEGVAPATEYRLFRELQEFRDGKRAVVCGKEMMVGGHVCVEESVSGDGTSTAIVERLVVVQKPSPKISGVKIGEDVLPVGEGPCLPEPGETVSNTAPKIGGSQWPVATGANISTPRRGSLPSADELVAHVQRAIDNLTADVRVDAHEGDGLREPEIVVTIRPPITLEQREAVFKALAPLIPATMKTIVAATVKMSGPAGERVLRIGCIPPSGEPPPPFDAELGTVYGEWVRAKHGWVHFDTPEGRTAELLGLGEKPERASAPTPTPTATTKIRCPNCHGTGECEPMIFGQPYPCRRCGGSGEVG